MLTRPGAGTVAGADTERDSRDPLTAERTKLADALSVLNAEKAKFDSLSAARETQRERGWSLSAAVSAAETRLADSEIKAPRRRAMAAAGLGGDEEGVLPIEVARSRLAEAEAAHRETRQLEDDLDDAMLETGRAIGRAESRVAEALASVVCGSAAFRHLLDEQVNAWVKLRGVAKALLTISRTLGGAMPHEHLNRWAIVYPLEPAAVTSIGSDEGLFTAWRESLDRLLEDPTAALPSDLG